jgi:hypothetical protein
VRSEFSPPTSELVAQLAIKKQGGGFIQYFKRLSEDGGRADFFKKYLSKELISAGSISLDSNPDPDPDWIRIQSGQWIRIRIRIRNPDPDPGGKK